MGKVLGIVLPISKGRSGYFNQGLDIMTQAKSNLINLVLTKKGERVMQPEFGCDIHRLVFENITDDITANVRGYVISAAKTWLPYIEIVDVRVTKDNDRNEVFVSIVFNLVTNPTITQTVTIKI
jgi:phage baseplate assembly protein W